MSIPGAGNPLLLGGAGGYKIERSLRFNSSDSAYLSRTPASAGNRQTWTLSWWMKRSKIGGVNEFIFGTGGSNTVAQMFFDSSEKFRYGTFTGEPFVTAAVFRDVSAWYHCVFVHNTANATAADRLILYVNGVRADTSTYTAPTQNSDGAWNRAVGHVIGGTADGGSGAAQPSFNGYLADIHFIDGQALTPSSFGETDINGVWQPKAYSGSYGTNGFKLAFADNSAATATTLGKDTSGNGNNWTPNNLSVSAGAGNDSLVDSPTNYGTDTGAGGEVRGNYCTLNPISLTAHSLSNGNLDVTSSALGIAVGTVGMSSGKWYWEFTLTTVSGNISPIFGYVNQAFNIATAASTYLGSDSNSGGVRRDNGQAFQNNTSTSYTGAAGFAANDVAMIAFDADAKKMWIGKNGTWYNSGAPASGTGNIPLTIAGTTFFAAFNTYGDSYSINFGQRPFAYTAPSGFKALCTQNLPEGTITTSGSFTGNANADGPFVYLNGVPTAMTINSNAVTFGTHADKLSNGFKLRTNSTSYNTSGSNTYTITTTGAKFKNARAQSNP